MIDKFDEDWAESKTTFIKKIKKPSKDELFIADLLELVEYYKDRSQRGTSKTSKKIWKNAADKLAAVIKKRPL